MSRYFKLSFKALSNYFRVSDVIKTILVFSDSRPGYNGHISDTVRFYIDVNLVDAIEWQYADTRLMPFANTK